MKTDIIMRTVLTPKELLKIVFGFNTKQLSIITSAIIRNESDVKIAYTQAGGNFSIKTSIAQVKNACRIGLDARQIIETELSDSEAVIKYWKEKKNEN